MEWVQVYNPTGSQLVSTLLAAAPIVVLLGLLGIAGWSAPKAASAGLIAALALAIFVCRMPVSMALASAGFGACFGLFPIGWIVLGAVFLYVLTVEAGQFEKVKCSIAGLSPDRRIQALLIAFSFGAFVEGAAGFGTPVAISSALMIGAGFPPLYAAGLALIANTAPVAFGALGTPIIALAQVTGISADTLGAMAGRQLPFVSLIIPAWMVVVMSGWRGLRDVWPAVLLCGGSFALVQYLVSNFIGPTLVDIAGGLTSLGLLTLFLRFWQPKTIWTFPEELQPTGSATTAIAGGDDPQACGPKPVEYTRREIAGAWVPWLLLSLCVFAWGLPQVKTLLEAGGRAAPKFSVPSLDQRVRRDAPVATSSRERERAVFQFNWLSATGTGIFIAAILSAAWMRVGVAQFFRTLSRTFIRLGWPLFTIAAMMAIAYTTRFSGADVILGLAFTRSGPLYPFFAPLLGWLGVAITGSDTSSNALFGSLQKITAQQLGLNPVLIATANSTGGVMGKMIDAQSIVVSASATGQYGNESRILRFVFWHSLALAGLMGLLVLTQAYFLPGMIPRQ